MGFVLVLSAVRPRLRALASRLFRRRVVWLPTIWGVLLCCALGAAFAATFVTHINGWLSVNEPAVGKDGRGARALIVEGWLEPPELDQVPAAFSRGHYERVITTGGPIPKSFESGTWMTYAERAAAYLRAHGLAQVPMTPVPGPASTRDRTYWTAVEVRRWAERSGARLDAVDVFSGGTHALRSRMVYRLAMGDAVEVGALAARPVNYDPSRWWTSSAGAKAVVMETVAVVWTVCCFWPSPLQERSER